MDIHPLVVHFPIALLVVGAVCDAIGILNHRDFFLKTGYFLFSLGALTAIVAALTGDSAAETAQHIDNIAIDLDDHDDLGTMTTVLAVAITLVRTHLSFKKQFTGTIRYIYLAFALVVVGLVCASGYTGGHLVYHHGAGTNPVIKSLDVKPEKLIPRTNTFESQ